MFSSLCSALWYDTGTGYRAGEMSWLPPSDFCKYREESIKREMSDVCAWALIEDRFLKTWGAFCIEVDEKYISSTSVDQVNHSSKVIKKGKKNTPRWMAFEELTALGKMTERVDLLSSQGHKFLKCLRNTLSTKCHSGAKQKKKK